MNANTSRYSLIGALLLTLPSLVLAAEPETGWSIELKAVDTDSAGTVSAFTLDDERSGTALGIGYSFNKFLTVQANYADLGDHFASDCPAPLVCLITNEDEVDVRTLAVTLVAAWPINDVIELYGKVGVAAWDADFRRFARDDSDRELVYGAGIGAWLTPNWRISLEYEKVDEFDLESLGLGLAYRF